MAKRRKKGRFGLLVKLVLLAALIGAGYWFYTEYEQRSWRPDEATYPDQGALIGERDAAVDFAVLKGLGASFVYLEASRGARGKDANFSRNLAAAREAGLQVGAVHLFDPCETADGQSANYVTIVPRDADLLPAAIKLTRTTDECFERVSDAAVQSELLTLKSRKGLWFGWSGEESAFMRGRTLADAFVILDEAQNTTREQMKMFLTRFGQNSRMVICGDPRQVDIPGGDGMSGLADAVAKLEGVEGFGTIRFTAADVVRHPIVGRIVEAYEGPAA